MEAIDARLLEFANEFDGQVDAVFLDSRIVFLQRFQIIPDLLWHMVVAEGDYPLETSIVLDRENTRENGASNTNCPRTFDKVQKRLHIKEELGHNQICAGIDLFLQV